MERLALAMTAGLLAAGCQVQNPLAIGPPRVPAPSSAQSTPYYPTTANAPKPVGSAQSAPQPRVSVSAETQPPPVPVRPRLTAEAGDREPIRIVENPNPPTRTASSANRAAPPAPPGSFTPILQPNPPAQGSSGLAPTSPTNPPAPNSRSSNMRQDRSVIPASFDRAAPASIESPADGPWKAR